MIKSTGTLIYDPKDREKASAPWWAILEVDEEFRRFYAHLYETTCGIKLMKPQWTAHISVVKGEEPLVKDAWGKYHKQPFSFMYHPELLMDDLQREERGYVWMKVVSEDLPQVRKELGLSEKVRDLKTGFQSYHVTLGKIKPEDMNIVRSRLY